MKLLLGAALVTALAAAAPCPTLAATRSPAIAVVGTGEVVRAPDRALVDLTVAATADQAVHATAAADAAERSLRSRLAAAGVAPAQVRTTGYAMDYTPRPPRPNPEVAERFGFTVRRSLEVTAPSNGAGPVVDAAVASGVTEIEVRFDLADRAAAYRAALAAAVADAAEQARTLAAAAHVRLGPILWIEPGASTNVVRPFPQPRIMMAAAAPTTIAPGTLTVDAQVSVTYAIAR